MGCMDEKEVRKVVRFEYLKNMFGSCDKESLVELFAALLVKLKGLSSGEPLQISSWSAV